MSSNPDFLSMKQLAQIGGVSDRTVKRWKKKGLIPIFQPGGPGTAVMIPKCRLRLDMLPTDFLTRK